MKQVCWESVDLLGLATRVMGKLEESKGALCGSLPYPMWEVVVWDHFGWCAGYLTAFLQRKEQLPSAPKRTSWGRVENASVRAPDSRPCGKRESATIQSDPWTLTVFCIVVACIYFFSGWEQVSKYADWICNFLIYRYIGVCVFTSVEWSNKWLSSSRFFFFFFVDVVGSLHLELGNPVRIW